MARYVEVHHADGTITELRPDARRAEDRPQNIVHSTARGDGFKTCTFTLERSADREWDDVRRYDGIVLRDEVSGDVAWEGYVSTKPQTMDSTSKSQIECVGYMAHAKDRQISELIVERDLGVWSEPSTLRQAELANAGHALDNANSGGRPAKDTNLPQLMLQQLRVVTGAGGRGTRSELWFDAGPGNRIAQLFYDFATYDKGAVAKTLDNASWNKRLFRSDSDSVYAAGTTALGAGPGSGYWDAGGHRYVGLDLWWSAANAVMDGDWQLILRKLAVYGDHGIPLIGDSDPKGVAASAVLRYLVGRHCPMLDPSGILDTTYAIHQLRFADSYPYDAFLVLNGFHRWGLEVWEDRVLHFAPPDLQRVDWQISTSDPRRPITTQFPGPADDEQPNGIRLKFRDFWGGEHVLTPDDEPDLGWPDPEHDATRWGRQVWAPHEISQPTVREDAVLFGQAALLEANQDRAPAIFVVLSGRVLDGAGQDCEAWRVRAGQTAALTSHANDAPRLITETRYEEDTGHLTINVDNALGTYEGIQNRWITELQARNLI